MIDQIAGATEKLFLNLQSVLLLVLRLIIAYGFFEFAFNKWTNIENTVALYESINMPFPLVSVYIIASIESIGAFLLVFGLYTRLVSIPLLGIMVFAIATMHFGSDFSSGNYDFEVSMFYALILGTFATFGPGKISLDYHFSNKKD